MKKNQPKDQHVLPEMFLKGFVNKSNSIFMFDAVKNKISDPRNINSIAKQKHLYTVIKGHKKDYKVEENFSKIETHTTKLFEKIQATGFVNITQEDIPQLIDFIVLLFIRTPRAINVAEEVIKDDGVLSKMSAINFDATKKIATDCNESKGLSYAITLEPHFVYRHNVLTHNFDLFMLTAEEGSPPLILNDMFTCVEMLSLEKHYVEDNIDWSKMNVKKHFPVSNKHCVSFVPKSDRSQIGTPTINYGKAILSQNDVKIINRLSFHQKERYAYCSEKHILESALIN